MIEDTHTHIVYVYIYIIIFPFHLLAYHTTYHADIMCSSLKERNPSIQCNARIPQKGFPFRCKSMPSMHLHIIFKWQHPLCKSCRAGLTSAVGGCDTGMGPCGPTWHHHAVFVTWALTYIDIGKWRKSLPNICGTCWNLIFLTYQMFEITKQWTTLRFLVFAWHHCVSVCCKLQRLFYSLQSLSVGL